MASKEAAALEAQLIRRIAQHDREAFGNLYDRYSKPLYFFAARILNDFREAEDVLQEVFLQIWNKAPSFDEAVGKASSWAVTMTRNQAIDRLRARQRRLRAFDESPNCADMADTAEATEVAENLWRDQVGQVRGAVNELPDNQRRPIELAFFSGLTHIEISEALAEPLGTIKARIRRGMVRLRDCLEGRI